MLINNAHQPIECGKVKYPFIVEKHPDSKMLMLVEWKTLRFNEYRKVSTQKFYATEICILVDFAEKVNITD